MELIPLDIQNNNFNKLMGVYDLARKEIEEKILILKNMAKEYYGKDIINNVTSRIKTPDSIINKMKKKGYELNYENLIEHINDIAGIRVVCPLKKDVYTIADIISKIPNLEILNRKDYIKKPKKSGYSAYHLIVEIPLEYEKQQVYVKAEIQIRTMAMDFWSTNEHKLKYKSKNKLNPLDAKKLKIFASILNRIDDELVKMN